jgi:uncharacterized phage-associated protein
MREYRVSSGVGTMLTAQPQFNEKKATEVAARLVALNGGEMNYTLLIKLMYLIDREALIRWGFSLTDDSYFSLAKGPVLSSTLNAIKGERDSQFWASFIEKSSSTNVQLKQEFLPERVSKAEDRLIVEIFTEYGHMELWKELIDGHMHKLPEWTDPGTSSIPISYQEILKAAGKTEEEIQHLESEWANAATISQLSSDFK